MALASPSKLPLKQACDNCRRRKIKCSRELPCDKCRRLFLSCSYSDVLRRKGPKFRTLYPLAPGHPLSTGSYPAIQPLCAVQESCPEAPYFGFNAPSSPTPPPSATSAKIPLYAFCDDIPQLSCTESVSSPDSIDFTGASVLNSTLPQSSRLSPEVLLTHVNVYLKYLYSIVPVVHGERLRMDSQQSEWLSPQRYSFLVSLCAATHIQLRLDDSQPSQELSDYQSWAGPHLHISSEGLLDEALRARQEYDIVEDRSIENLLTSYFLFASYANMDKQDHAWFYLCQSTSMAFTMGLHRESTYEDLTPEEAEERRRAFWLLFITERSYALPQLKPLMLSRSIQKPQALCSENPVLAYGFISLINIFDKLTTSIRDGALEDQNFDILAVQQWLQTMMWKLSIDNTRLPPEKAGLDFVSVVEPGSEDFHGLPRKQKLFNMAAPADLKTSFQNPVYFFAQSTTDSCTLLWGILHTVSQIRGSPSYIFTILLERCEAFLGNPLPQFAPTTPDQFARWNGACSASIVVPENMEIDSVDQGEIIGPLLSQIPQRIGFEFQDCIPP